MSKFHTVCKVDEVPFGEGRMFSLNQMMVGVFNLGGKFFALDNRCPHAGASLAHGLIENDTVTCRIHHWKFRINDGICLDDGNQCNARTYPVRIVGDEVQIKI